MASPQAVQAILRAARPSFRNRHDKLAFAIHAYMLADGYKLLACGPAADRVQDLGADAPEVGLDGWTAEDGAYAFAYADASGKRKGILVKALAMGSSLVVHALRLGSQQEPRSLELDTGRFTTDSADPAAALQRVDELLRLLGPPLGEAPAAAPAQQQSQATGRAGSQEGGAQAEPQETRPHPGQLPPLPGGSGLGNPDLMPAGIPRDLSGVPGLLGGPEGVTPSGMHMGPDDPLFQRQSRGRPGVGLPEGPFPGARWDPIAPPGMEGFNARDLQRGPGGQPHPDIMPPGRGSGPNFDNMFG